MQKCDWLRGVTFLGVTEGLESSIKPEGIESSIKLGIALPKGCWGWNPRTWRTLLQRLCILAYQNAPGHQMLSRLVPSSLLLFPSPILEGRIRTNVLNALHIDPTKSTERGRSRYEKQISTFSWSGNNNPFTGVPSVTRRCPGVPDLRVCVLVVCYVLNSRQGNRDRNLPKRS
jgi:hypothetical protein